jgi:hypothetical protein
MCKCIKGGDGEAGSIAVAKENNVAEIVILMKENNDEAGFASVRGAAVSCLTTVAAPATPVRYPELKTLDLPQPWRTWQQRATVPPHGVSPLPVMAPVAGDLVNLVPASRLVGPHCLGGKTHPALVVSKHLVVQEGRHARQEETARRPLAKKVSWEWKSLPLRDAEMSAILSTGLIWGHGGKRADETR